MNRELEAARDAFRRAELDYKNQEQRVRSAHSEAQRGLDEVHLNSIRQRRDQVRRELDRLEDAAEANERQIEAVREATERQLAATRESSERQEALAREHAAEQLQATKAAAAEQAAHDERTFWFRRFFTTLGIANAGAFFAVATGLAQADAPAKIAPYLASPFTSFVWGMVLSGLIPLSLMAAARPEADKRGAHWRKLANYLGTLLAAASAFSFVFGLMQLVGFFRGMALH